MSGVGRIEVLKVEMLALIDAIGAGQFGSLHRHQVYTDGRQASVSCRPRSAAATESSTAAELAKRVAQEHNILSVHGSPRLGTKMNTSEFETDGEG